jgi:mannose-6-phosphate isomerase-like protein (cupin superfamily)
MTGAAANANTSSVQGASTQATAALKAEIEATGLARFKDLKPFKVAYLDTLLPEFQRTLYRVIGKSVRERADIEAPITTPHEYSIAIVKMAPGGGVGPHAHTTSEVFMPLNGKCIVSIGDNNEIEFVLAQWDTISVPTGVMRCFRNPNAFDLYLHAIVGGAQGGGHVAWHPEVVRRANEIGLAVVDGKLTRLPHFKLPPGVDEADLPK